MRVPFSFATGARLAIGLTAVVGSAVLLRSSDQPAFTARDKANYADAGASAINFVRPGSTIKAQSANVAGDRAIKARINSDQATDDSGGTWVGSTVLLSSSYQSALSPMDKAYYVGANAINFVGPALTVKVQPANIPDDGAVKAPISSAEPTGLPPDNDGVTTPGTTSPPVMIATIPAGQTPYVSHITRPQASPITSQTANRATYDSGGTRVGSSLGLRLSSSGLPAFTPTDKGYYAVGLAPGLTVKVQSANIAGDGAITARISFADPAGLPLDKDGVTTPGTISPRVMIATIPAGQTQYISYITRPQTSPITSQTANQATSDSGGTWTKVSDGVYDYTFKSKAPAGFDKHATHTIGVWAARDLSALNLDTLQNYDSDVFSFVPDGSQVVTTRDVVRTKACERCHDPLQAHDERRGVELCVLCHTPQTVDPDTGNTVDFPVMIHKIHAGSSLPSVKAGGKYQIIGYRQTVLDFSTVVFPAGIQHCEVCHDQKSGAAQAANYLKPTQAACGACHDDVNFANGQNHLNMPQISNNLCGRCHTPQGEFEYDASLKGAHVIPTESSMLAGTVFDISNVTNAGPGQKPTVTFSVKDKAGNPVDVTKMRLQLVMAGPTTDYAKDWSEDAHLAACSGGICTYTFKTALPANATGTFAVGIEGYQTETLLQGTKQQITGVRDAGINAVKYFSVDGSPVQPRRQVVSLAKCNSCHEFLSLHGGNRNRIEQCVLCHNPTETDKTYRPATQAPSQTIQFSYMIHRIHTGEDSPSEYTIYGYHGSVNDFTDVRFPGDRRDCNACHVNGSEQPPLPDGLQPVTSPRGLLNPMGPITAACTGCHTSAATASHALSNTTSGTGGLVEACATCHSTGSEFGIPKVHAR